MGRDLGAEIAPDEVETQIHPRGRSCRCQNPTVIDIQHVRIDVYRGVAPGQAVALYRSDAAGDVVLGSATIR